MSGDSTVSSFADEAGMGTADIDLDAATAYFWFDSSSITILPNFLHFL